jgi:hypothetical protein
MCHVLVYHYHLDVLVLSAAGVFRIPTTSRTAALAGAPPRSGRYIASIPSFLPAKGLGMFLAPILSAAG